MLGSALAAEVSRQKAKGRETDLILVRVTAHRITSLLGVRLLTLVEIWFSIVDVILAINIPGAAWLKR